MSLSRSLPLRRALLAAVLVAVAFGVASCGGGSDTDTPPTELLARLESAKKQLDAAETIDLSLVTKEVPSGVTGLLSATGKGNHTPAFDGDVKVVTGGTSIGAEVVAVDGVVYAKTGFSPEFVKVDPASLGAPDPAVLFATSGGVSDLLVATTSLEAGGEKRDGKDVLTTITGSLDGAAVTALIPSADASASFAVTYSLTDHDTLRTATIKGPFYSGGDTTTYTLTPKILTEPVSIEAP